MTPLEMLQVVDRWHEAGWLRSLDTALARWLHEMDPRAPASLLLATALVANMEGGGHSGLPLSALAADPRAVLGWSQDAADELASAFADWPQGGTGPRQAWVGLAVLEIDPRDESGSSPLVLAGELLCLRRYWRYESRVAAQIRERTGRGVEARDSEHSIDAQAVRELLGKLFPPTPAGGINWQKAACALALRGRLTIITGGPGTGKTWTAARLLVLLHAVHSGPNPLRVALAAPTGKAAARLRQSINKGLQELRAQPGVEPLVGAWATDLGPARTLHSHLGTQRDTRRFKHDAAHPLDVDVLVVDEASMVHLEMMAQVLEALPATARVVLLGDKDQLASVEAGAVMGELCQGAADGGKQGAYWAETAAWIELLAGDSVPAADLGPGPALAQQIVVLRESHRFAGQIGEVARAVNQGEVTTVVEKFEANADGDVSLAEVRAASAVLPLCVNGRPRAPGGYGAYLKQLRERPTAVNDFENWAKDVLRRFDGFRVLCAVRDGPWGVSGLNAAIERALVEAGLLSRRGEWYEGRPVMVTRNNPALGVFNGDVGVVMRAPAGDGALRCYFLDGEDLRSVAAGRLADVETAFAMTIHKSQGSEFEHVTLVLPDEDVPVLTRELIYTGITRASEALTVICKQRAQLVLAVSRLTNRVSGLQGMLE